MAIMGASIARGLAMIVSLGFDYCLGGRTVSIDLETLWKTLVAGGVIAGVLVPVQIVFYSRILLPA
jgi:hypothetical protein